MNTFRYSSPNTRIMLLLILIGAWMGFGFSPKVKPKSGNQGHMWNGMFIGVTQSEYIKDRIWIHILYIPVYMYIYTYIFIPVHMDISISLYLYISIYLCISPNPVNIQFSTHQYGTIVRFPWSSGSPNDGHRFPTNRWSRSKKRRTPDNCGISLLICFPGLLSILQIPNQESRILRSCLNPGSGQWLCLQITFCISKLPNYIYNVEFDLKDIYTIIQILPFQTFLIKLAKYDIDIVRDRLYLYTTSILTHNPLKSTFYTRPKPRHFFQTTSTHQLYL